MKKVGRERKLPFELDVSTEAKGERRVFPEGRKRSTKVLNEMLAGCRTDVR